MEFFKKLIEQRQGTDAEIMGFAEYRYAKKCAVNAAVDVDGGNMTRYEAIKQAMVSVIPKEDYKMLDDANLLDDFFNLVSSYMDDEGY